MTTPYHEYLKLPDGSVAVRIYPGGRWKTLHGAENRHGDIYGCQACVFVTEQNEFTRGFHRESVAKVSREGRP